MLAQVCADELSDVLQSLCLLHCPPIDFKDLGTLHMGLILDSLTAVDFSPPSLALILENTSLSQKAPILPPDRSPLSKAAFLDAYAVSNSFLLMGLLSLMVAFTRS